MAIKHSARGRYVDTKLLYTGEVPSSTAGAALQANYQCSRNWEGQMLAMYSGRQYKSINGGTSGSQLRKFHLITAAPERVDSATLSTRRLAIAVNQWASSWGGTVTRTWRWYRDYTSGAYEVLRSETTPEPSIIDGTGDAPTGGSHIFTAKYIPETAGDGFRCSVLTVDYATIASLSVFEVPQATISDAQGVYCSSANFSEEQTIRGYDSDCGTSVGAIAEYTNYPGRDTMAHNTRRCLFQTPYPVCAYSDGVSTGSLAWNHLRGDSNGNPMTYRVLPRNLTGASNNLDAYPAIVLGSGTSAGTAIRLTSASTGATWTYTLASTLVSDTLITASSGTASGSAVGLEIDPDEDYVLIECYASTALEMFVKTVSLWEPASGGII